MKEDFRTALFSVRKEVQAVMDMIVRAEGLSPVEGMVLTHLSFHGGATLGEIVHYGNLNQGNASTLCKRMEKDGLLTRTRCGEDERVVRIGLTARGREIGERIKSNAEILRDCIEAEAARRGIALDELWAELNEIFIGGIRAYRARTDAPVSPPDPQK